MNFYTNINIFSLDFILSIILFSIVNFFLLKLYKIFFSSSKLLDIPNKRSSHTKATPKGAGLVFSIISIIFITFIFKTSYFLILIPLLIIGILDDYKSLSALSRLSVQLATSLILVFNSNLFKFSSQSNGELINIIFFIFLVIASVGIINFFNFADGIDGLVASSAFIYFIFIGFVINPMFLFIGVALGVFLIFNWSPAKLFMGDVGSTFIGAVVVISSLSNNDSIDALALLFMIAPILIDTFFCVLRRLLFKQNLFVAHKSHLYQRLHQSGWKHSDIALIYAVATFILCSSFIFSGISLGIFMVSVVFVIGLYLDFFHASPFIKS